MCYYFCHRAYIGMTAHWIEQNSLERQKSVLACKRLHGAHTYDVLAKNMDDVFWDYDIEGKLACTTTDNGSNFVKAFK